LIVEPSAGLLRILHFFADVSTDVGLSTRKLREGRATQGAPKRDVEVDSKVQAEDKPNSK
jgi:hypothetical protein